MAQPVLVDDIVSCKTVVANLLMEEEVAVDIEGVELGRHPGKVCIVQMCGKSEDIVYLFDITVLEQAAFEEGGLLEVFESATVRKVFFDVRSDCDALYHNHKVNARNVYDLQVLHVLKFHPTANFLPGLKTALAEYAKTEIPVDELRRLESIKEVGLRLFAPDHGGSYEVWDARPLEEALVTYCAADVKYLLKMKDFWGTPARDEDVLRISPARIKAFVSQRVIVQESKKNVDFKMHIPAGLKADLPEGMVEEVVRIKEGKVGRVIGRNGATIKGIESSSGARLSIQDQHSSAASARVIGTPAQVDSARRQILAQMR